MKKGRRLAMLEALVVGWEFLELAKGTVPTVGVPLWGLPRRGSAALDDEICVYQMNERSKLKHLIFQKQIHGWLLILAYD
jgi:hypothetical protein